MANISNFQNQTDHEDQTGTSKTTTETLLTADEVGEILRLTSATVCKKARELKIPHIKIGRTYRFRSEAIHAWLESQATVEPLAES